MGKASREKGKRGERELSNVLKEHGYKARRGVQYQGGSDSPDVIGLPGIHIECKRTEKFRLEDAMQQAKEDCDPFSLPAVFHRKNGKNWVVVMDLEDWLILYDKYREPLEGE